MQRIHTCRSGDENTPCSVSGGCEASRNSPPFILPFTTTSTRNDTLLTRQFQAQPRRRACRVASARGGLIPCLGGELSPCDFPLTVPGSQIPSGSHPALPPASGVGRLEAWFSERPAWWKQQLLELDLTAVPEPQGLTLMALPNEEEVTAARLRSIYYTMGDSDLF